MRNNKLHVALIWHMHQPLYKDRISGKYGMPWVRLHAIKDYLDMLVILEKFPNLKQTFNLVPCLIEQIEDYCSEETTDPYLELSSIPVKNLSSLQKSRILENFFDLNWEKMVAKFPRYYEILKKREHFLQQKNYRYIEIVNEFTAQEYLDLTCWFNIAWFDYIWQQTDNDLKSLIAKGRNFTEAERIKILNKQLEIIRNVIPKYREMQQNGQIEITTTPYYHPILPILCDSNSARVARPHLNLPEKRYHYPEDAHVQLSKGVEKYKACFGTSPKGIWPSEQSVSPQILPALQENEVKWIVSDEGILFNSLKHYPRRDNSYLLTEPEILYKPYLLKESGNNISMLFRDIHLSDAIGFVYSKMHPYDAANDLYWRLKEIQKRLPDDYPYIVTIALDGENCWEHYTNDGYDFLNRFYSLVSDDSTLDMTTVNSYLEKYPAKETINHLFSGSWIRSDFTTWIGEPTKNRAWDILSDARKALTAYQKKHPEEKETLEKAWEEIYIAEGSDWFWWFGEGNSSRHDDLFDLQFRLHVQNIYNLMNKKIPDELKYPLYQTENNVFIPDELLNKGWTAGKAFFFGTQMGTMYQWGKIFNKVYYGQDKHHFNIRIEYSTLYQSDNEDHFEIFIKDETDDLPYHAVISKGLEVPLNFYANHKIHIDHNENTAKICSAGKSNNWLKEKPVKDIQVTRDYVEIRVPFSDLKLGQGKELSFIIIAFKNYEIEELIFDPVEYKIE